MLLFFSFLRASMSGLCKCVQLSVPLQVSVNSHFHKRLFMLLMVLAAIFSIFAGTDPASSSSQGNQGGPSVVLGSFNISEQGDGVLPDFGRVNISAIFSCNDLILNGANYLCKCFYSLSLSLNTVDCLCRSWLIRSH